MPSFFDICCGEGEEERKFGSFVDPELAKELGWVDPTSKAEKDENKLSESDRIQHLEKQISRINRYRQSQEHSSPSSSLLTKNGNEYAAESREERRTVFCRPLHLDSVASDYEIPDFPKTPQQIEFLHASMQDNFIFGDLEEDERRQFVGAMKLEQVAKGTKIIQQGDTGDFFYIVDSGTVDFVTEDTDRPGKLGSCQAGGSFGELALLYDAPRAVSCIAATDDVAVWKVDQFTFKYMLAIQQHEHSKSLQDLIRKIAIFRELPPKALSRLVESLTPIPFSSGKSIVKKGEEGSVFYIIQSGNAKVHDIGLGDSKMEEVVLGPGDYFGERALMTGEPRAASVTAITDVVTMACDRQTFETSIGSLKYLMEREGRKKSLKSLPMFAASDVTEPEYERLVDLMQEMCYLKGHHLAEIGKPYQMNLWMIRHGRLLVYSQNNDKLYNLGSGDYFGDKSVKGDPDHLSSHTATCEENLTTSVLTRENIEDVIGDIGRLGQAAGFTKSAKSKSILLRDLERRKLLGQGAFGRVWLVSHEDTAYALKVVNKSKVIDAKLERAVIREKELLCLLDHPFILHLVASYQDEDNLYLLLPLVPGGELFAVLRKHETKTRGLENNDAAFYSACIIEALGHFHQRHIAYRDLKLENVMISQSGYCKIVDLGFAKVVDQKTYTLCGTPEMLAPEIIMSKGHDESVDYWSFGVLVYELIVSHTPFYITGSKQTDMFKRIVRVEYEFPSIVNDDAKDLIKRLLIRRPSNRLGNLANGYLDIKKHPWFKSSNILFKEIVRREAAAPWKPVNEGGQFDASNFEDMSAFENQREPSRPLTKEQHEVFKGF